MVGTRSTPFVQSRVSIVSKRLAAGLVIRSLGNIPPSFILAPLEIGTPRPKGLRREGLDCFLLPAACTCRPKCQELETGRRWARHPDGAVLKEGFGT